ncbi:MAG: aminoacyl-tRNA hydrolase [Gammaproteobacteria bacterium]
MASSTDIRLIAGLGNPGGQYEQTRHNAGFWFVDQLARHAGATLRHENKFHGDVAKTRIDGHDVWLLKPDTFMNLSGQAVSAVARFYKIDTSEILVVHDEIDLPPGTVRLKKGGGHGGNNGLRDIIAKLGRDFIRLRVGVGRPQHSSEVTNYVLRRPTSDEQISIERAMDEGEKVLPLLLGESLEKAMHRLHSSRDEPSVKKKKKPSEKRPAAPKEPAPEKAQVEPKVKEEIKAKEELKAKEEPGDATQSSSLRDQIAGLFRRND